MAENQSINQNFDKAKAIAKRGETYRLQGRFVEALAAFNQAIALKPDYIWAIAHRGVAHRRLMYYEEALADFNRAVVLKPDYAWAIAYRGVIYTVLGRYAEAVIEFDQAITLDETFRSHWGNERGFPLSCLGRYIEAIESFEQALKVKPDDPLTLYCIAVVKVRWQGLTQAQTDINKARAALQSGVNTTDRSLTPYGLGGLAALEGYADPALNYLQEAILLEKELNIEMARHDLAWLDLRADRWFQSLVFKYFDN